jgi:hypothetical protein
LTLLTVLVGDWGARGKKNGKDFPEKSKSAFFI